MIKYNGSQYNYFMSLLFHCDTPSFHDNGVSSEMFNHTFVHSISDYKPVPLPLLLQRQNTKDILTINNN